MEYSSEGLWLCHFNVENEKHTEVTEIVTCTTYNPAA